MPQNEESSEYRHEEGRSRYRDNDRRDYKSNRREYDTERSSRRERDSSYRRERDRYGYGEEDRERERRRDRDRYDRDSGRDRRRDRSASPRSSRPRSGSRSRSRSPVSKAKPNFGASGLLAAETNTVKSVDGKNSTVLKYNEPPEARKPSVGWRLYVFKGDEQTELLHIHKQSAYLIGRDRLVADIVLEHPSCSKQHAAIQYRFVQVKDEFGGSKGEVKPFIIDLESTNGTHVNGETIPTSRYYELQLKDVVKFGQSTKEYILLHDEVS
ncbi:SMAD/FHA domain-containing protein [Dendrothele bispora CBS 962.96]|uniref:SMAD/FHA domain-containing protein n=1 Tax=Dendrothele bispora (strain CBS 962.96) TaxID=1314807 RepID=A0A4V4HHS3_DENBC|nr:SMAD/FHA domain-containing protein [Dendrothele bispora CBS 962.96]